MITSKLNSAPAKTSKELVFPAIYRVARGPNIGACVLFTARCTGAVVVAGGALELGEYSKNWADCDDVRTWDPLLPGESVTIIVG